MLTKSFLLSTPCLLFFDALNCITLKNYFGTQNHCSMCNAHVYLNKMQIKVNYLRTYISISAKRKACHVGSDSFGPSGLW